MTVDERERSDQGGWSEILSVGPFVRLWSLDLPDEDSPEAGEIRSEQMASFARQTSINTLATISVSLWLAVILWPSAPQVAVLSWTGLTWAVALWHLARWWRRREEPQPRQVSRAGPRKATVRAAVAGALWGVTILFHPYLTEMELVFVVITVAAMAAGASSTMGAIPTAASAFAICAVVPWIGLFAAQGKADYVALSIMAAIFLLAMIGSSRVVYVAFMRNLRGKQANAALLAQFHAERDEWFEISDTSEAFALFDAEGCLLLWNDNYRRILSLPNDCLHRGASRAEILRHSALPEDVRAGHTTLEAWVAQQLALHETAERSLIERLSNGRWLRSSARRTSRGRTVTLHVDITELKERENALRHSEEKLRDLLEGSIQGVYIHRDWQPVFVNQAMADMLGYDGPDDLLSLDSIGCIVAAEDYPRLKGYRKARMHGEEAPARHTARYLRKDGSTVCLEANNSAVVWGGVPAIQSTFLDVTDRVRAEEALRASERRFQDFAEASADWFWEMDAELRFTYISERYEAVTGGCRARLMGRSLAELHGRAGKDGAWAAHLAELEAHRPFRDFQIVGRPIKGRSRYYRINGKPLFDGDGSFTGYRGIGADVTEHKLAEEALLEREARLRDLQAELFHVSRLGAMGQLSSALAHELNQPLAAIMNYAQAGRRLLETGSEGVENKVQSMMTKVVDQAGRAGDVIRRLRDLFEKGETAPRPQPINQVVEDAAALALIDAPRLDIKYKLNLSKDLPIVIIDRVQIQQVVLNLVRNALEAVAASERRELAIETSCNGQGVVEVAVDDSGPGLPREVAKRLFEPFVTDKRDGMGVGLSISHRIIEAHGGRLWAEPNPAGGTCFRFTLPVAASLAENHVG
jgi:PAS domain S-box-containing protein